MAPDPMDVNTGLISPVKPYVIVLFGATGDLARRKLLPGLLPPGPSRAGARLPHRRHLARRARRRGLPGLRPGVARRVRPPRGHRRGVGRLRPLPELREPVRGRGRPGQDRRRARERARRRAAAPALPERPAAARHARWCGCWARPGWSTGPGSSWRSRSAPTSPPRSTSTRSLHETFDEDQIFRIDHFLGQGGGAEHPRLPVRQRALRADLEPPAHRPRADRRARDAGAGLRRASTSRPAPTATWW